ncbi:RraA family protein [Alkalicoccobacillus murimartini]|uniref:Putative 4-hydroxy-4-methyl-2-oxoglutarate aldolase n=1 Tax=Alkalicoccobacillus murimartini TaxID=171685 RepID=A0ABT9YEI7_9BACI|nr:RraA family protein [Alkalicoccobacillus murimartini]MDQ0206139.1 RraA family protein [Alkalicoccobacillus murimartini]
MTNVGFRINQLTNRPSKELIQSFAGIPAANIGDGINRTFCMNSRIRPYNRVPLLGSAFTVKARAGDNLLLNKAIDMAEPGDVIVVDGGGELSNALLGEMMITWANNRNIAGFIVDGAIRDADDIAEMTIPVYAAGVSPAGPYKDGPGEINVPISCGGVTIHPGDIIVGDGDGVVVIQSEDAPVVLEKAKAVIQTEKAMMESIQNGTWNRSWVDEKLKEKGCEFVESKK